MFIQISVVQNGPKMKSCFRERQTCIMQLNPAPAIAKCDACILHMLRKRAAGESSPPLERRAGFVLAVEDAISVVPSITTTAGLASSLGSRRNNLHRNLGGSVGGLPIPAKDRRWFERRRSLQNPRMPIGRQLHQRDRTGLPRRIGSRFYVADTPGHTGSVHQ